MKITKSKVKRELANKEALKQCAKQFGATGHPTRVKICYLLCKYPELSVSEIADLVGISVSAVSQHLAKLKDCQIVSPRRDAQTIYYSLQENDFTKVFKSLFLEE